MPATSTAGGQDVNAPPPGAPHITWFIGRRAEGPIYRITFSSVTGTTGWSTRVVGNLPARMMTECWPFPRSTITGGRPNFNPLPDNDREWVAISASAVPG